MNLILASASPQREKLLKKLKIPFQIIPSQVDEPDASSIRASQARKLTVRLAREKAKAVFRDLKQKNSLVLGADTIVVCNNRIFGKPKDEQDAQRMLEQLSGNWQTVITGLCMIYPDGTSKTGFAETRLLFKKMDPKTIQKLAKKNLDKSGAYAIQKMNDRFVQKIIGALDNVIGLPLTQVRRLLGKGTDP